MMLYRNNRFVTDLGLGLVCLGLVGRMGRMGHMGRMAGLGLTRGAAGLAGFYPSTPRATVDSFLLFFILDST